MKQVDIAVVGLGAVGSAALYFLSKSGFSVLGLDRFDPPHAMGSSHGETRITRLAVGEGEEYVNFAQRSQDIWRQMEQDSGTQLFKPCGGILLDSGVQPWSKHGGEGFFERTKSIAKKRSISHELLDSTELEKRYGVFDLPKTGAVYFEPSSGYLFPEKIIETQLDLALKQGAQLRVHAPLIELEQTEQGVCLQLKEEKIMAQRVLLCNGGWIKDFLPENQANKFKICRQVLHWIKIEDQSLDFGNLPVFMWGFGPQAEDFIYGFPSLDGESIKVATESFIDSAHPDFLNRSVNQTEQEKFWNQKIQGKIKGLKKELLKSQVCFYTVREDSKFVIGKHPDSPMTWMVSACSGHGFKHSAAIGEKMSQQLLASLA